MLSTRSSCSSRSLSCFALLSIVALLLGGCATANRVAISPQTLGSLAPVDGVVGLRQQEIGTQIVRSDSSAISGQFGLIGSLVGSIVDASANNSRGKKAESAAGAVRDSLLDYHPGDVLAGELRTTFADPAKFNVQQVDVRPLSDTQTIVGWVKTAGTRSLLLVDFHYDLAAGYDGVVVRATVSLHAGSGRTGIKAEEKPNLPPVVYYNFFSSLMPLPNPPPKDTPFTDKAARWSQDHGQLARQQLNAALKELAAMIAYDLAVTAPPKKALYKTPKGTETRNVTSPNPVGPPFVSAFVEHTTGDRVWLRVATGELCAVSK